MNKNRVVKGLLALVIAAGAFAGAGHVATADAHDANLAGKSAIKW